jgi:hypothetical protein
MIKNGIFIKVLLAMGFMLFSTMLIAGTNGNTGNAVITALGPLIVLIAAPLIARLFKKLGIDINESVLEPILLRLIEIIAAVEKGKPELNGSEKKAKVVDLAKAVLSSGEKKLLVNRYGSLETAVQAAFERSSVGKK